MNQNLLDLVRSNQRIIDAAGPTMTAMAKAAVELDRITPIAARMASVQWLFDSYPANRMAKMRSALSHTIRKTPIEHLIDSGAFYPRMAAMRAALHLSPGLLTSVSAFIRARDVSRAAYERLEIWRDQTLKPQTKPTKQEARALADPIEAIAEPALADIRAYAPEVSQTMSADVRLIILAATAAPNDGGRELQKQLPGFIAKAFEVLKRASNTPLHNFVVLLTALLFLSQLFRAGDAGDAGMSCAADETKASSPAKQMRILRCQAPVMQNPSTHSNVLLTMPAQTEIAIMRSAGKWAEVTYIDPSDSLSGTGWIQKKYLIRK